MQSGCIVHQLQKDRDPRIANFTNEFFFAYKKEKQYLIHKDDNCMYLIDLESLSLYKIIENHSILNYAFN